MIVVSYIRKDKRYRTPWDLMIHHIDYASPAILRRINRQYFHHGKIVIENMEAINAIYTKFFPDYLPARTVIGVSELPAGALVQIDAVMSNAESTPASGLKHCSSNKNTPA